MLPETNYWEFFQVFAFPLVFFVPLKHWWGTQRSNHSLRYEIDLTATVNKTACYWCKDKQMGPGSPVEKPETDLFVYGIVAKLVLQTLVRRWLLWAECLCLLNQKVPKTGLNQFRNFAKVKNMPGRQPCASV